ncbi:hypothetical protein C8R42DRAFT_639668 [Lentinula raphanica]|nr:hypothetical protein C8R42DRAFT_639668 [Lentinula raphanica]
MFGRSLSSSFVYADNTSDPRHDVTRYWYHKGFVEGLKRARAPSSADENIESLTYDLSETRVRLEETQVKLSDTAETLGEFLKPLVDRPTETYNNGVDANARGPPSMFPSPQPGAVPIQPANSPPPTSEMAPEDCPPPAPSPRRRIQHSRPIRREYVELARSWIPGYYSTSSNSALVSHSVDNALEDLFRTAQAGNERSMALVKALCREAHATPPEQKTYGQRRILSGWRNPFNHSQSSQNSGSPPDHLVNPQYNDPPEVWVAYYTRYPKSLPRGVRVDPRTGAPFLGDVTASRLLARLRPTSPQYRAEFNIAMTKLFITKGQYAELIRDGVVQIPRPTVDYQPFDPGCSREEPINMIEVAQHYSRCGVSVKTVETNVEFWVVEYAKRKQDTSDTRVSTL